MTQETDIRTRADGSIDTAHYMARGREMRSFAFWAILGKLRPQPRRQRPHTVKPAVKHPVKQAVKAPALPRTLPAARAAV